MISNVTTIERFRSRQALNERHTEVYDESLVALRARAKLKGWPAQTQHDGYWIQQKDLSKTN